MHLGLPRGVVASKAGCASITLLLRSISKRQLWSVQQRPRQRQRQREIGRDCERGCCTNWSEASGTARLHAGLVQLQGQLCGSPAKNSPKTDKRKRNCRRCCDDLWLGLPLDPLRSSIRNLRNVILIWSCLALKGNVANIQIATRRRRAPIAVNLLSIVIPCMWVAQRGYMYI